MDAGVAEYWIVDPEGATITGVRGGHEDRVARDNLVWSPPGSTSPLTVQLSRVFG